jgi:hypothetical protein
MTRNRLLVEELSLARWIGPVSICHVRHGWIEALLNDEIPAKIIAKGFGSKPNGD